MINFTMLVGFIVLVLPLLVIMMAMATYADMRAKEVDLEANED